MALRVLSSAAAAFAFSVTAFSQTVVDASLQIQALAPQLTAFAGSSSNFQSLANGLVQGAPVVLSTITADGITQTVTLAPQAPMTPIEAARALEAARQFLIARGIASPTAQQLGTALVGGPLTTALGTFQIPGTVTGGINPSALSLQQQAATPFGGSVANFQSLTAGLTRGGPITLAAAGSVGAVQNLTFSVPGAPLTPLEASQALQLANRLLSQQGVSNPTPEQIRTALLGGILNTGTNSVAVQGVLQGRGTTAPGPTVATSVSPSVNTSNSPAASTSASPTVSTSASQALNTSASPAPGVPASAGASNGSPSPAAQMQGRR